MKVKKMVVDNTTEAMSVLDTYITANPKVDILHLLGEDTEARDNFQKWRIVKKNKKDMGLNERRNTYSISKASFRKSKGSLITSHSDEETN
jgi:hypothetical protein